MRLFFALWPPARTAGALSQWAQEVHGETGGSLVAPDKIHLTLAFLGDVDAGNALDAAQRVRAQRQMLQVDQARYWKHNRIVWVGPRSASPELVSLVSQLHGALKASAFVLEERPFAAHITLLRKAKPPQVLAALPALDWPVSEFLLVRSRTSPKGATYEPVERFALG